MRTAKSCGPDTSVVGVKSVAATPPMTVSTKPDHRGERDISRKPLRGECRVKPGRPDKRVCVLSLPLHTRLAGASSARYSPRPLFRGSRTKKQTSRENTRRDREVMPSALPSLHALSRVAGSEASKARSRGRGRGSIPQEPLLQCMPHHPPPPPPPAPSRGGGGGR